MKLGDANFTTEMLAPLPCIKAWCDKQLRYPTKLGGAGGRFIGVALGSALVFSGSLNIEEWARTNAMSWYCLPLCCIVHTLLSCN